MVWDGIDGPVNVEGGEHRVTSLNPTGDSLTRAATAIALAYIERVFRNDGEVGTHDSRVV